MDFGSISGRSTKSSMKRKQSSSLLTAFRKSSQPPPTSYVPPPSTTSSHFPEPESPYSESVSSQSHSQAFYNDFAPGSASGSGGRYAESTSSSSRTAIGSSEGAGTYPTFGRGGAGRVKSGSGAPSVMSPPGLSGSTGSQGEKREKDKDRDKTGGGAIVRRPEDLVKVTRDRLVSWSYMMLWYQGDTHWFNTVKIPRTTTEAHLGPKALESRARNFFILGISLGLVFDIANGSDFLKAVNRVLDEWETMGEGGSKVRGLFKGQKGSRKSGSGGEYMGMQDGDSAIMQINLPFTLDFFQIHSTTCSLIRDIYRKILRLFLPSRQGWSPPPADPNALTHPSTIIHSAPFDSSSSSAPPFSRSNSGSVDHSQNTMRSPSTRSTSSASHTPGSFNPGAGYGSPLQNELEDMSMGMEQAFMAGAGTPGGSAGGAGGEGGSDSFQAFICGELGPDQMLVGEGQALTKEVVELFAKVDGKLRKHFSSLLRETDMLARRVLDDELNALMASLNPGARPMSFDYNAALSNTGNGFALGPSRRGSRSRPSSAGTGYQQSIETGSIPPVPLFSGSSTYGRERSGGEGG